MRRTWNTSVSPTIGIIVAGIGKIGLGPGCALAGLMSVIATATVAPAAAASRSRREEFFMAISPEQTLRTRLRAEPNKPDEPISGIRLSDRLHRKAHDGTELQ